MNKDTFFSGRDWLLASGIAGSVQLPGLQHSLSKNLPVTTPPLTAKEISAIETAFCKKGNYIERQSVHPTPLPRWQCVLK